MDCLSWLDCCSGKSAPQVPLQMKRFDRNVGTDRPRLSKAPKVLDPIGVYLTANIGLRLINYIVHETRAQFVVGSSIVGEYFAALLHFFHDLGLQRFAFYIRNDLGANLS